MIEFTAEEKGKMGRYRGNFRYEREIVTIALFTKKNKVFLREKVIFNKLHMCLRNIKSII